MFVYCKLNNFFHIYDGNCITKSENKPSKGGYLEKSFYDKSKSLDQNLKEYHKNLIIWFDEVKQGLKKLNLPDSCYESEVQLMYLLFKIYRKDKKVEYEPITYQESIWFDKCNKGGLVYGLKGYYKNVKAYDFKKFYSNILGHYNTQKKIPVKEGEFKTIEELPKDIKHLQYGIYRVKILSKVNKISCIFGFSKDNYYTHEDIQYATYLKKLGYIETIELINDGDYNALVYDELIRCVDIFKTYVGVLNDLSYEYPKNQVIKSLLSRLWGRLSLKNREAKISLEKWNDMDEDEKSKYYFLRQTFEYNKDGTFKGKYLHFVNSSSIFKYNLRLQPFLGSFARRKMGGQILNNFDDIIRVQIDGVIYKNRKNTRNLEKGLFVYDKKYNNKDIHIKDKKKVGIL